MPSVFSHIIQKRLSQQNEDVATDALACILKSSFGCNVLTRQSDSRHFPIRMAMEN